MCTPELSHFKIFMPKFIFEKHNVSRMFSKADTISHCFGVVATLPVEYEICAIRLDQWEHLK